MIRPASSFFGKGFYAMIPVTIGVVPFGAVMGTVCAEAQLSFFKTCLMNIMVYSGAAQLAAMDLMGQGAATAVVVATGLVINLRFLLYSAALSPVLKEAPLFKKILASYTLTDQSYAVMTANEQQLQKTKNAILFYFGTATCMWLVWQSSVVAGYIFGNFAPPSWSLDFAVPLSFLSLVLPTLKNRRYLLVACCSSVISVVLYSLPYKTSLLVTAFVSMAFAAYLVSKEELRP